MRWQKKMAQEEELARRYEAEYFRKRKVEDGEGEGEGKRKGKGKGSG